MNRKLWSIAVVLNLLAILVFGLPWAVRQRQYSMRKAWKETTIPEIARFADDAKWVSQEIGFLHSADEATSERIIADRWLTDRMVLMASGEWLVYKSHCNKVPPRQVRDIFLAKGSNGRWYYSTCHFCVRMCGLVIMQHEQPYDLATFAQRYNLREFDDVSDECLQATQTFPNRSQIPPRAYTGDNKPGLPDLSPLMRIAAAVISVATNSDPALAGHGLELCGIRYEHKFPQHDRAAAIIYTAIYRDSTLQGGDATGIGVDIQGNLAHFKSQAGRPLWSSPLEGQLTVPENAVARIALEAVRAFGPKIDTNRLSLDEIVCSYPMGGNTYSVSFRLADADAEKAPTAKYSMIEVEVGTNGSVLENEARRNSR